MRTRRRARFEKCKLSSNSFAFDLISGIGIAYPVFLVQAFLAKDIGQEVVQYQEQS